jgi:hypothetical protein
MQKFLRNHSRLIQTPLIHEGGIKKRGILLFLFYFREHQLQCFVKDIQFTILYTIDID